MRRELFIAMLIFLSMMSCISGYKSVNRQGNEALKEFKSCQRTGDMECMSGAFKKMVAAGFIRKGMSPDEVVNILGKPQHGTGIYLQNGYSYGYGNKEGNTENYPDFYWIHFKSYFEETKGDSKAELQNWD